VPVIRVLAQADIARDEEVGVLFSQELDCEDDGSVWVIGERAAVVLQVPSDIRVGEEDLFSERASHGELRLSDRPLETRGERRTG
jgi:hypothetical protein